MCQLATTAQAASLWIRCSSADPAVLLKTLWFCLLLLLSPFFWGCVVSSQDMLVIACASIDPE